MDLRTDLAGFSRRVLGRELREHQLEAARSEAFVTTIAAARRTGKTVLAETLAIHTAFSHSGSRVLVLSATQDAARRLTESIGGTLNASKLTRGTVVDDFAPASGSQRQRDHQPARESARLRNHSSLVGGSSEMPIPRNARLPPHDASRPRWRPPKRVRLGIPRQAGRGCRRGRAPKRSGRAPRTGHRRLSGPTSRTDHPRDRQAGYLRRLASPLHTGFGAVWGADSSSLAPLRVVSGTSCL